MNEHPRINYTQYSHSNPAPGDRMYASVCLYRHSWIACQKITQPHQWPTYVTCKSKLRFEAIHAPMHGNWVASGVRCSISPGLPTHLVQEVYVGTVHVLCKQVLWWIVNFEIGIYYHLDVLPYLASRLIHWQLF